MADVTPRTPGLDPERGEREQYRVGRDVGGVRRWALYAASEREEAVEDWRRYNATGRPALIERAIWTRFDPDGGEAGAAVEPDRVTAAAVALPHDRCDAAWLQSSPEKVWLPAPSARSHAAERILEADDDRARSRGLVATGDGLTRDALRLGVQSATVLARQMCHDEADSADCTICNARRFLAALPSSLLDNPEADRG